MSWTVLTFLLLACGQDPVAGATTTVAPAPAPEVTALVAGSAHIDDRLTVGAPVVVGGLAMFVVTDRRANERPAGEYVLLADALGAGTLAISEVDAGGNVPTLHAHNTGSVPVLAMAGDVIRGGKQDRVVTQDVLIEPSDTPQPLAVNCVEQSRWSESRQGLAFSYAGRGEVDLARTVQTKKSQSETWSKVAELNDARGQAPQTGTYGASLGDAETRAKVDAVVGKLGAVSGDNAVGVVVALRGELESAEIYDNPAIFSVARGALVRSVAMDAVGKDALTEVVDPPTPEAAAAWVRDVRNATPELTVEQPASAYHEKTGRLGTKGYELRAKDGRKGKETFYKGE